MKKIKICILILIILILSTTCYATSIPVTEEKLKAELQEYKKSNENFQFTVENDVIKITSEGKTFNLKYNLVGKPTFSIEVPITQGMSWADFKKQNESLSSIIIGYTLVANIQGAKTEDAALYITMWSLDNEMKKLEENENPYIIYDDTDPETSFMQNENNTKIIYASEFGDRVMEYVNDMYKNKETITDISEINSFEWVIEKKETTNTSCKLVSTLIVNTDADFSKLDKLREKFSESFMDKNITKENADYSIMLKVGQKCIIEANDKIMETSFSGNDCLDINDDTTEITATKIGKKKWVYICR